MKISFLWSVSSNSGGVNQENKQGEATIQSHNYGFYPSIVQMCEHARCLGGTKYFFSTCLDVSPWFLYANGVKGCSSEPSLLLLLSLKEMNPLVSTVWIILLTLEYNGEPRFHPWSEIYPKFLWISFKQLQTVARKRETISYLFNWNQPWDPSHRNLKKSQFVYNNVLCSIIWDVNSYSYLSYF